MSPIFWIFAACAFAAGFALRIMDPLILPVSAQFNVLPATAALLSAAYALPYALAQPFLGPLGDRYGKPRCICVCMVGLATALVLGAWAPSFEALLVTRVVAGTFAGGTVPLVLAGLGDAHAMRDRQVMIGRMLLFIITGQMLGSAVAGAVSVAYGWRCALWTAAAAAVAAAALANGWLQPWQRAKKEASGAAPASFLALYRHVFDNPKAVWLYAAVIAEGALVFGVFPYVSPLLLERTDATAASVPAQAGWVLGGFGVGSLAYALTVRHLIARLGVRRMCQVGSAGMALLYATLVVLPVWWLYAVAMAGVGLSYYMLHNSLQTHATELAPAARGSAVALFACGFFGGQALGAVLFGAVLHAVGVPVALLGTAVGIYMLGRLVDRKVLG